MARVKVCDICNKPLTDFEGKNPIVAKLFLSPHNGKPQREARNRYSAHMDIGKCCLVRVNDLGGWQKRKPQKSKVAA